MFALFSCTRKLVKNSLLWLSERFSDGWRINTLIPESNWSCDWNLLHGGSFWREKIRGVSHNQPRGGSGAPAGAGDVAVPQGRASVDHSRGPQAEVHASLGSTLAAAFWCPSGGGT